MARLILCLQHKIRNYHQQWRKQMLKARAESIEKASHILRRKDVATNTKERDNNQLPMMFQRHRIFNTKRRPWAVLENHRKAWSVRQYTVQEWVRPENESQTRKNDPNSVPRPSRWTYCTWKKNLGFQDDWDYEDQTCTRRKPTKSVGCT